jgi:hypothetical protein
MQLQLSTNLLYMPDYDAEKSKYLPLINTLGRCNDFITTFADPRMQADAIHGKLKYMAQMVNSNFNPLIFAATNLKQRSQTH